MLIYHHTLRYFNKITNIHYFINHIQILINYLILLDDYLIIMAITIQTKSYQ
jgi:hypothetical protein